MGKHTELWFICKGQPLKQWYFPVFHRCMYKNLFEQNYKWNYKFLDTAWKKSAVTCLQSYYTYRHIPHLYRLPSSPPYLPDLMLGIVLTRWHGDSLESGFSTHCQLVHGALYKSTWHTGGCGSAQDELTVPNNIFTQVKANPEQAQF